MFCRRDVKFLITVLDYVLDLDLKFSFTYELMGILRGFSLQILEENQSKLSTTISYGRLEEDNKFKLKL